MKQSQSQQAFTLVELMVVTLILSLIVAVIYSSLRVGLDARRRAEVKSRVYQTGRVILEQMAREIRGAYLPLPKKSDKSKKSNKSHLKFVGVDGGDEREAADTLDFVSTSSGSKGLSEIGYFISNDLEPSGRGLQKRIETVPDDKPLEGGSSAELSPYVSGLNLRYYDGMEWQDNWDSGAGADSGMEQAGGLPMAVEIELTVQATEEEKDDDKPTSFFTIVSIPSAS